MKSIQFILLIAISGCSALEGEQKTNVNDIIKSHEIKQVSTAEILFHGGKFGHEVYEILKDVNLCDSISLNQTSDSICETLDAKIFLGFNSDQFTSADEKGLWEAYEYNSKNAIKSQSSTQIFEDKVLFTAPVENSRSDSTCIQNGNVGMWSIQIPIKTIVNSI